MKRTASKALGGKTPSIITYGDIDRATLVELRNKIRSCAEALQEGCNGVQQFNPRYFEGLIDGLVEDIMRCDRELENGWFGGFVKLVDEKRCVLVTTPKIRQVSAEAKNYFCCICVLTLFDFYNARRQAIVGALVAVCDLAHKHASGDELGWEDVRDSAKRLIDKEDMKQYLKLDDDFADEEEKDDVHGEWELYVRRGATKYCGVSVGHKVQGEDEGDRTLWDEDDDGGRDFFLAYHQLSAFAAWVKTRTLEEQGMVQEFEVSSQFLSCMFQRSLSNVSFVGSLSAHGRGEACARVSRA